MLLCKVVWQQIVVMPHVMLGCQPRPAQANLVNGGWVSMVSVVVTGQSSLSYLSSLEFLPTWGDIIKKAERNNILSIINNNVLHTLHTTVCTLQHQQNKYQKNNKLEVCKS